MAHRKQSWSKQNKRERAKKRHLSRMQATRLLQTDSMGFRRLCILKGVYPRAVGRSKQKASGNEKQYYLTKEIKWLVHDQITQKQHDFGAFQKKVAAARAQHRWSDLETIEKLKKPQYRLDATIKERYPFFVDAVKDLDDAMSMVSLYAFLSPEVKSDTTIEFHHALPTGLHDKAKAVVADLLSYVSKAHLLSRAFISIKGYYYEVFIHGQRLLFLMPHEYASKFPDGIQQYVLITFLEFYVELMRFIMHKLNRDWKRDEEQQQRDLEDNADANVADFDSKFAGFIVEEAKKKAKERNATETQRAQLVTIGALMEKFVVFVSREVPSKQIKFVVESCGGRVVNEFGPEVTHFCVDRPALLPQYTKLAHVEYVQPQYFFDCLNARLVLPVNGYRMGEDLPPHISPFTTSITNLAADNLAVEDVKKSHPKAINEYVPSRVHEIRRLHDPNYIVADPKNKLRDLDEGSEASEADAVGVVLEHDDVDLSDDEVRETRKQTAWVDEEVKERPERSKLSAFKVKKQREMGLLNAPSSDATAANRRARVQELADRKKGEDREDRAARKMKQLAIEDRATQKMKLQVARKKAAKFYKMVSANVNAAKRHGDVLRTKAESLAKGKATIAEDGKTFTTAKQQRLEKKVGKKRADAIAGHRANPYKKLPVWVQ